MPFTVEFYLIFCFVIATLNEVKGWQSRFFNHNRTEPTGLDVWLIFLYHYAVTDSDVLGYCYKTYLVIRKQAVSELH